MRLILTLICLASFPMMAHAACTTPTGDAGAVIFSQTAKTMQYCNGTNWVNTGKSEPAATQAVPAPPDHRCRRLQWRPRYRNSVTPELGGYRLCRRPYPERLRLR